MQKQSSRRPTVRYIIVGFVLALGCVGAFNALNRTIFAVSDDRYEKLDIFAKVLHYVEENYVEKVNSKDLIYGAIKGMLATLDPHSNFLPPDVFEQMKGDTTGEFGGLGIEITVQDDVLTIVSPIEDTPAYGAGLKGGDKIIKINGESTQGITIIEAVNKLRGKKGSQVTLTVVREGVESPFDVKITRAIIRIESVKVTELEEGVSYIRLSTFHETTGDALEKNLREITRKKNFRGVILDVRDNPGGLLDQAIAVADLFLREGVIVSTVGRDGKPKDTIYAHKEKTFSGFPVVVIVNGHSASASEIVAGALQDHKRALIVGTQTFGKGSVQTVIELSDKSALKLTVAKYYTPKGNSIQAQGIKPDLFVEQLDMAVIREEQKKVEKKRLPREIDLPHHIEEKIKTKEESKEEVKKGESRRRFADLESDYQLRQALNYLKTWGIFKSSLNLEAKAGAPARAKAGD